MRFLRFTFPESADYDLRERFLALLFMSISMQFAFSAWWVLLNNFAVEQVGVNGFEFSLQQSIREIPGLLSVLVIYLLLFIREQKLALVSLFLLGVGVAVTGYFISFTGFVITTLIMSIGFHYYETVNQSLALQWLPVRKAPALMGTIASLGALSQLCAYALVFMGARLFDLDYQTTFLLAGGTSLLVLLFILFRFPVFPEKVTQRRRIVLRPRYWLYYLLTFLSGARRQIFTVFAGFLMVEKFGFHLHDIAALYFINGAFGLTFLPAIGRLIGQFGERVALVIEYSGLLVVFIGYAFVSDLYWAIGLYLADHFFFSIAIAMKTYFQKIADPEDMAPTASVAFTINHIAAVFLPALLGLLWLYDSSLVFMVGAGIALASLMVSLLIPRDPKKGNETLLSSLIPGGNLRGV